MSPRIQPALPPFPDDIQARFDRLMPPGVQPLALFTLLARDRRLLERMWGGSLLDAGNLSLRQREIIIGRITALCGCEYEWGIHIAFFGKQAGFSEEQIASLVRGSADDAFWTDEAERTLIAVCDMLHERSTLDDALWQRFATCFSEVAQLEALMLAGYYRTISYLANATALPLEPYAARFPAAPESPSGT